MAALGGTLQTSGARRVVRPAPQTIDEREGEEADDPRGPVRRARQRPEQDQRQQVHERARRTRAAHGPARATSFPRAASKRPGRRSPPPRPRAAATRRPVDAPRRSREARARPRKRARRARAERGRSRPRGTTGTAGVPPGPRGKRRSTTSGPRTRRRMIARNFVQMASDIARRKSVRLALRRGPALLDAAGGIPVSPPTRAQYGRRRALPQNRAGNLHGSRKRGTETSDCWT